MALLKFVTELPEKVEIPKPRLQSKYPATKYLVLQQVKASKEQLSNFGYLQIREANLIYKRVWIQLMKPKTEDKTVEYLTDVDLLYQLFSKVGNTPQKTKDLFSDILTPAEIRMVSRRWHIARLLNEGRSIREAAAEAKVGTDTVVRISKKLQQGTGALQKVIKDSQKRWHAKVKEVQKVEKSKPNVKKTVNKWVFGTVENTLP